MPVSSAWMVRLSFIYLAAGFVVGALMMMGMVAAHPLRLVHADWLLLGFMLQLAFGVASWILPRTPSRKSAAPVWIALGGTNLGLALATAGAMMGEGRMLAIGRLTILLSAAVFAVYIWPRVRSFKEKLKR